MRRSLSLLVVLMAALSSVAAAQSANCNTPAQEPSVTLALGARPFTAVPTSDGCQIYVSVNGTPEVRGVLQVIRSSGKIAKEIGRAHV